MFSELEERKIQEARVETQVPELLRMYEEGEINKEGLRIALRALYLSEKQIALILKEES